MVLLHIGSSLLYGFCATISTSYINLTSIIVTISLVFLTVAGMLPHLCRIRPSLLLSEASAVVGYWLRVSNNRDMH